MPFEMFLRSVRRKIFEGFAVWERVREVYGVKPIGQPKALSLWGWGGAISSDPHVSLPIGGEEKYFLWLSPFPSGSPNRQCTSLGRVLTRRLGV